MTSTKPPLWKVYDNALMDAKYVDLTHTITPRIPVWSGFGPATFGPATNPATGQPYTYAADGFEATRYLLQTDQLGTQLDPPAHWAPEQAAIDELPATFAVRPLVVISIVRQLKSDDNYALQVNDIRNWERRYGKIPRGSVVMVRSDWSKRWPDPELATLKRFPGVGLDALKFLHRKRHILFHGHEPLDTDSTPTLEGEHWLMHNGYAQAEGWRTSTRCRRPSSWPRTARKREVITTRRCFSIIFGHTTILAMPVSSSSVRKITPLAVPGRCRTSTSPATVTRWPASRSSQC